MRKIAVFFMSILIAFSLCACSEKKPASTPDTSSQTAVAEGFKAPESYAAVIKIKINPEFNLYVDKDGNALALEAVNSDAKSILNDVEYQNQAIEATVKSIISAANKGGFAKDNANVSFEIIKVKDDSIYSTNILNKASAAVSSAASELKITLTVSITQQSQDGTSSKESQDNSSSKNSSTDAASSKPASSAVSSKPTSSTSANSSKPVSSEASKNDEPSFLNPKTNLPYDKEYAGYYRLEAENLIASGIAFYKEGGMDGGAYCLLLSPQFEPTKTDEGQMEKEFGGKKFYSVGAGMTPYNIELTDTEIIVKNSFYDETATVTLKLTLKTDNTFAVTYSQSAEYPVGTVLSYLRG